MPVCYVTIYCEPRDGSARRVFVKSYRQTEIPGTTIQQALREARELCQCEECEIDVRLRHPTHPLG